MDVSHDESFSEEEYDALSKREEALRRMNAAIDGELAGVVLDVDNMLERQRKHEKLRSSPPPPTLAPPPQSQPLPLAVGSETASRIKRAQRTQLEARLEEALASERDAAKGRQAALERASRAEVEIKALKRELTQVRGTLDKESAARTEAQAELATAKHELTAAQRALRDTKREAAQLGNDHRAGDVRLRRAIEDADKHKAAVAKLRNELRDAVDDARKERERQDTHIRKLEKQKAELLAAFRKQLKLIDILKRQKLHIEAARLLAFTEDDFLKLVTWGEAQPVLNDNNASKATGGRLSSSRVTGGKRSGAGAPAPALEELRAEASDDDGETHE